MEEKETNIKIIEPQYQHIKYEEPVEFSSKHRRVKILLVYLGGLITGIILTILCPYVIEKITEQKIKSPQEEVPVDSITVVTVADETESGPYTNNMDNMYEYARREKMKEAQNEKTGEIINEKSFRVFQVQIRGNEALVMGKDSYGDYYGIVYFLVGGSDTEFYDEQIIKVPKGKVVRRIGTYRYFNRDNNYKAVPKIKIVDK